MSKDGRVKLVCPHCRKQGTAAIGDDLGPKAAECAGCGGKFQTLIAEVRAKRSRGSKRENTRAFDVRVHDGVRERMLRFVAKGQADIELRSGDLAAFSFIDGGLNIVQNVTVGEYLEVQPPGWSTRTVLVAVVIGVLILLALAANGGGR